jgi:hypothetical protein
MPIRPEGSTLIFTHAGSSLTATTIVDSLVASYVFEPFDRMEYDNDKLKSARTAGGVSPQFFSLLGGTPAQIETDCTTDFPRPLVPNSTSTFNSVKQRFNIKRYQITGAITEASQINTLFLIAKNHRNLLAKFQNYQARSQSDSPYEDLILLQSETFSYLTSTGLTISGTALEFSESNMLITDFSMSTESAVSNNSSDSSRTYYKSFSITIENRTITSLGAT